MDNLDCPIILVVGLTGAGKSSFIRTLVDNPEGHVDSIGHGLVPYTLSVTEYPVKIGNETIILVDTPGLDHPGYVFEDVAEWMSQREKPIKSIDGIILLHPISRNRMTENSVAVCTLREEFSKLLGVSLESRFPFYRVVLATTFWTNENVATGFEEVAEEDYTSQLKRERELQTDWWKLLEVQGAMFRRHDNTTECARDIVWSVLKAQVPDVKTIHVRDQLIIAIIGATQAGKSALVATLTNTGASDELESPMAAIEPYEVDLNGESVILLDTPGLDTTRDKADVFHMIAEWLKGQAKQIRRSRLYLDGIVVVHPIISKHDERYGDLVLQSVLIEQANKLLGGLKMIHDDRDANAYRRIILATTKWDQLDREGVETAIEREQRIRRSNWNIMHAAGAPIIRFDNTPKSAERIIESIIEEKKSGDAAYQYRNIKATLNEIKFGLGHIQEQLGDMRRERVMCFDKMKTLREVPSLDEFINAACRPRD